MYKIVKVDKDTISFIKDGDNVVRAMYLSPIIYEYTPGEPVLVDEKMECWHKEDYKRIEHLGKALDKMQFNTIEDMKKYCNSWR